MPDWIDIQNAEGLLPGQSTVVEIDERRIGIYNIEGSIYAIDNQCPHRGASLAAGAFDGALVTCPLHRWQFNLITGMAVEQPGTHLKKFDAKLENGRVFLDRETLDKQATCDGIHRHLIRYGTMGWVGVFGTIEQVDCQRGDPVIIQTNRGRELGETLMATDNGSMPSEQPIGELLGIATDDDISGFNIARDNVQVQLISECDEHIKRLGINVEIVDSELLFDQTTIVFYYVGEATEQLGQLSAEFGNANNVTAVFHPLIEPEGGGCGSGGCGCHSEE